MYCRSIRSLTLEDAVSHGTQSRGSHARARQQWKDEHGQNRISSSHRPLPRGLPPGTIWRNAFAKQAGQQDHLDDVDRTDN